MEVWLLIAASLLTVELFLRGRVLSKCLTLAKVLQRAQRGLKRREVTEGRKEQVITELWLRTMWCTATLALTILIVFSPLMLLYVVDFHWNLQLFSMFDFGVGHFVLIFAVIGYALARRLYGE